LFRVLQFPRTNGGNKSMRLTKLLFFVACLLSIGLVQAQSGNEPCRNPDLPVEDRIDDLLGRMTLEEKIGQVTLVEKNSIKKPDDIASYYMGGLLSGGGGYPQGKNNPAGWYSMVSGFNAEASKTRLGIPLLYGVDAVHGHNNLHDSVIFPHNIG